MIWKRNLVWYLIVGAMLGGIIGVLLSDSEMFMILNYGKNFGLIEPIILDLGVILIYIQLSFSINIASILGIFIGGVIYKYDSKKE